MTLGGERADRVADRLVARGAISREPARPSIEARARWLLIERLLRELAQLTERAAQPGLLIKGAALAELSYAAPWMRPMVDVDMLVAQSGRDALLAAALEAGFSFSQGSEDRERNMELGETTLSWDAMPQVPLEMQTSLDKVGSRPVSIEAIARRAGPSRYGAQLLLPTPEDQLLLVLQHLAVCEFRHPWGFVDMALLLDRGLDEAIVQARARSYGLTVALYVADVTLEALGVRTGFSRPQLPGWRRGLLRAGYRLGSYPLSTVPYRLGLPWMLRQIPLRDSVRAWSGDVHRYAATRLRHRLGAHRRPR